MRLAIAIAGVLLSVAASAQELRPPPSIAPTQIIGSTAPGRSVLIGSAAQGASALGLGTGDAPTLTGLVLSSPSSAASTLVGRILSPAAATGTSATALRIEKGAGYGAEISGYLTQGSGAGMRLGILNNGTATEALRIDGTLVSTFAGPTVLAPYTVATLPAGTAGAQIYVSNGRKVGEAAGSGTGVPAYFSNSNWRRYSDDTPVAQ